MRRAIADAMARMTNDQWPIAMVEIDYRSSAIGYHAHSDAR
jgi:hypothetical protein